MSKNLTNKDLAIIRKIIKKALIREAEIASGATEKDMAILRKYGYTKPSMDVLHTDELVEEVVLPMLRRAGYKDAEGVVGKQIAGGGLPETTVWVELRGWIIDAGTMCTPQRTLFRKDSAHYLEKYVSDDDEDRGVTFSRSQVEELSALANQPEELLVEKGKPKGKKCEKCGKDVPVEEAKSEVIQEMNTFAIDGANEYLVSKGISPTEDQQQAIADELNRNLGETRQKALEETRAVMAEFGDLKMAINASKTLLKRYGAECAKKCLK